MPKLLTFVEKTHPILREVMPLVDNFKDPTLHETIDDMCYSILPAQLKRAKAAYTSAAGMAANQWGIRKRVFLVTANEGDKIEVMLNPSYIPYLRPTEVEPKWVAAFEGCFSIPLTTIMVNRYEAIMAIYYTPTGDKIERVLVGWEARVFQHETDHLDGKLCDGVLDNFPGPACIERIIFQDSEEMEKFWLSKGKSKPTNPE
jgi:peptide deformylase